MADPVWLPLQPCYLPWDLARRAQWMCWKPEPRSGGGWNKPPRDPRSGIYADKTNPGAWGTIYEAIAGMHRYGLAGVGYCVTAEDPFTFADLDHCRDPESGVIDAEALAIIAELASFTELSPSGTGVRIIMAGSLPASGRRKHGVELYDDACFLTITGHHLAGTPWTIHERTHELAVLHARLFPPVPAPVRVPIPAGRICSAAAVLDKARTARNGATFEALYSGHWEQLGRYPSQSEADYTLCKMLGYWSGEDPVMVDSLFRQSNLYRDKWDQKHHAGGLTYGERTVICALNGRP